MKALWLLFAGCLGATGAMGADGTPAARELVALTRVAEFELQYTRYLLAMNPSKDDAPAGFELCVDKEARPRYEEFFEGVFERELSAAEREQAIGFFKSPAAQQAIALRMDHEARKQQALVRDEAGPVGRARYPAAVQTALDGFAWHRSSPIVFSEQDALHNRSHRLAVSDLRVAAQRACWRALGR